MSFTELLENLSTLTPEQRQIVIERALELEDPPLTEEEERLVEERLDLCRTSPESCLTLSELKARLQIPRGS